MPSCIFIGYYRIFILPYISMKNRAYSTGWTPLHLVPQNLFNSILARRTALRLTIFLKYLLAARVNALKLRSS